MKGKILNESPLSAAEVKDELKQIRERDGELNFRATKTEDYLNQLVTLGPKKVKELKKKLEDLKITRLREQHIAKIMDVLPTTEKDVKVLVQGYAITVTKENMKKIADTVKEFVKE
jgi:DNA-directed RNA polymerase subunit F